MPTSRQIAELAEALESAGLINTNAPVKDALTATQRSAAGLAADASWHVLGGSSYVIFGRPPGARPDRPDPLGPGFPVIFPPSPSNPGSSSVGEGGGNVTAVKREVLNMPTPEEIANLANQLENAGLIDTN